MSDQSHNTRVLYNADCPVCRFEIDHYADYSKARSLPLRFEDLNTTDLAHWGISRDQAAGRLYLQRDGELLSGIPAFLVLWSEMPRYRWLARIVGLPGIRQCAMLVYDIILAPLIYRWHLRRVAKRTVSS